MVLCADAVLDGESLIGDPTEGALIVLGAKGGLDIEETRKAYPRVAEVPFDSEYKFMATFHEMTGTDGRAVVRCYVKGAPDVLISRGGSYRHPDGTLVPVTDDNRHLASRPTTASPRRRARHGGRAAGLRPGDVRPAATCSTWSRTSRCSRWSASSTRPAEAKARSPSARAPASASG
jgi:hypothetical protein